jgi:aryl-alcohol dehydrogenase (NADP+)
MESDVTSALLCARTVDHLDRLLAALDVTLTDDVFDRIDKIVPLGPDVGTLDQAYQPPALQNRSLRRRPLTARAAACPQRPLCQHIRGVAS